MALRPTRKARWLLLLTTLVWGSSFSVVKAALRDASPMVFNLLRMATATAVLAIVHRASLRGITRAQWKAGACAGLFLGAGYQLQTLGLARTGATRSAFLTGLVVVLVPLVATAPPFRRSVPQTSRSLAFTGASLAFAGLVLLTSPAGSRAVDLLSGVGTGDLLTLGCAVAYSLHLLTLARVSRGMSAGLLATLQIGFAAAVMLLTLPAETSPRLHLSAGLAGALLFTSILSTAAAFTIQSYAQQHLRATETSLLLTLEPVFAFLTSAVFLGERLQPRALAGAALILISIAVVELTPGLLQAREVPS